MSRKGVRMQWLREIKYFLSGGKRKWFLRESRRLDTGAAQNGPSADTRFLEVLEVGLQVEPEKALGLYPKNDTSLKLRNDPATLQAAKRLSDRALRLASVPALRLGWAVALRFGEQEAATKLSAQLAGLLGVQEGLDATLQHLRRCREQDALDSATVTAAVKGLLSRKDIAAHASWRHLTPELVERTLRSSKADEDVAALCVRLIDAIGATLRDRGDLPGAILQFRKSGNHLELAGLLGVQEGLDATLQHLRRCHEQDALDSATVTAAVKGLLSRKDIAAHASWRHLTPELVEHTLRSRKGDEDIAALRVRLIDAIGAMLRDRGDLPGAIQQFRESGSHLELSRCHELAGDFESALKECPRTLEARRIEIVKRMEDQALEQAERREWMSALAGLRRLRETIESAAGESSTLLARRDEVVRHHVAVLGTVRALFQERLAEAAETDRREVLLDWAKMEEAAGECSQAALRLEQTGMPEDRMRASRLWERDQRYGEAILSLGPLTAREDAQREVARLRERAGDVRAAAALFEHLRQWDDALRLYQQAEQWDDAARCFRGGHTPDECARSSKYADLLLRQRRVDELVELMLKALERTPDDAHLRRTLRSLWRNHGGDIRNPAVREAVTRRIDGKRDDEHRRRFDAGIVSWIREAKAEVASRYSRVWGMDLGTSKSAVAIYDIERGESVVCLDGDRQLFPSTLAIDTAGREVIGIDPRERHRTDLVGFIEQTKRAIGSRKVFKAGGKEYTPEEVGARLIGHGRRVAEAFWRQQVRQRVVALCAQALREEFVEEWLDAPEVETRLTELLPDAVVTVPAYFNFDQRRATRDAASIVGVNVRRLMAEPTAACLSTQDKRLRKGRVLVVDLGAGTLDLSVIDVDDNTFQVDKVFGDTHFGGADFDTIIAEELSKQVEREASHDLSELDRLRLRGAAEDLKVHLSSASHAVVELMSFAGRERWRFELDADRLATLLEPKLQRLDEVCRRAMREIGPGVEKLVLVGGPMLSLLVRTRVQSAVRMEAHPRVNSRVAAALGAACQGAILSAPNKVPLLLLDVVPFALGLVSIEPGKSEPKVNFLVARSERIPARKKETFSTWSDGQTTVAIEVFMGDGADRRPQANHPLATFKLEGIEAAPKGVPKIDVTFDINADGVLDVSARNQGNGKEASVRIENATWLSPAERDRMANRLARGRRVADQRSSLDALLHRIEALSARARGLIEEDIARVWDRQFNAWKGTTSLPPPERLTATDHQALGEMYNLGEPAVVRFILETDRLGALPKRCERFAGQIRGYALPRDEAEAMSYMERLAEEGRTLEREATEQLSAIESQASRFRCWRDLLAYLGTLKEDPAERFVALHQAGEWGRAIETFSEAYGKQASAEIPEGAALRHLDSLARAGCRREYRDFLAELSARFKVTAPVPDRLNDFAREVKASIVWVKVNDLGSGSGFLVRPDCVVTNRHVVWQDDAAVEASRVILEVNGAKRTVKQVRCPDDPEVDLAVLKLGEPVGAWPVRLGYSNLVEVGERVFALGFPLCDGESFDENLLLDGGIVNRIRMPSGRREFEVSYKMAPGMSGGPVFNDRGEVVAVSTKFRLRGLVTVEAYAIAVDQLHTLLPVLW
jgi:molecular chaperone DnaK